MNVSARKQGHAELGWAGEGPSRKKTARGQLEGKGAWNWLLRGRGPSKRGPRMPWVCSFLLPTSSRFALGLPLR